MKTSAFFNQNIYNWRTGNGDEIFPDPRYINYRGSIVYRISTINDLIYERKMF